MTPHRDAKVPLDDLIADLIVEIRGWRRSRQVDRVVRAALVAVFAALSIGTIAVVVDNRNNIRELACTIVASVPNNPAQPQIKEFRDKYHCPDYVPRPKVK